MAIKLALRIRVKALNKPEAVRPSNRMFETGVGGTEEFQKQVKRFSKE